MGQVPLAQTLGYKLLFHIPVGSPPWPGAKMPLSKTWRRGTLVVGGGEACVIGQAAPIMSEEVMSAQGVAEKTALIPVYSAGPSTTGFPQAMASSQEGTSAADDNAHVTASPAPVAATPPPPVCVSSTGFTKRRLKPGEFEVERLASSDDPISLNRDQWRENVDQRHREWMKKREAALLRHREEYDEAGRAQHAAGDDVSNGGAQAKRSAEPKRRSRAKAKSQAIPSEEAMSSARPQQKRRPETRWGRCMLCDRALVLKLRHADGNPFLSCPRWPACSFACGVPPGQSHMLPDVCVIRRRVDI